MLNIINQIFDFMQDIFSTFVGDIIVSAMILLLGFVVGKVIERIIFKFLKSLEVDKTLKKASGIKFSLEKFLSSGILYFIYFVAVIMALGKLGIATTVLQIIFAGVMVLVVVAAILAIKDFIPNSVAGFMIYHRGLFKVGDVIKVKDIEGVVIEITLLETKIEKSNEDIIHIPNVTLNKNEVIIKKSAK